MGKKGDLNGIDCGIDVGARRAGLSFSEAADLEGFLMHNHLREWAKKEKTSSEQQFCRQKMPYWCQRSEENGQTGLRW